MEKKEKVSHKWAKERTYGPKSLQPVIDSLSLKAHQRRRRGIS